MKIAVLGTGKMGAAMAKGLTRDGGRIWDIVLTNTTGRLPEALSGLELPCTNSNREAVIGADIVILAVLPQQYPDVLAEIRDAAEPGACLISIAPGYTLEKLNALTNGRFQIVRAMPNTPAAVVEAMSAVCFNDRFSEDDKEIVLSIFRSFGAAEEIDEGLMDTVTGLSGSSPAFIYMLIEAMADEAVRRGMKRDKAYTFAAQAVKGSAEMVLKTKKHPGELKDQVTSPNGTTIAGVCALEERGFRSAIMEGIDAAIRRSEEMSQN